MNTSDCPEIVRRNKEYIHILSTCKPRMRKALLQSGPPELIHCLCEVALNSLAGVVQHSPQDRKKLQRHKHKIRELASRRISRKRKKEILVSQSGGFLPLLLKPLVGILTGLFSE